MNKSPIPSRNKSRTNIDFIKCPYCGVTYSMDDETDNDYYMYLNTKINICRNCSEEFINNITRDVTYKYNNKCKRKDGR